MIRSSLLKISIMMDTGGVAIDVLFLSVFLNILPEDIFIERCSFIAQWTSQYESESVEHLELWVWQVVLHFPKLYNKYHG